MRRARRAALVAAFLLGPAGAAAAQQESPLPPPAEMPASRLTVTPSDFARWVAGTPDRPEVAAVPEDRPPALVAPPPPPPPLLTQPPPPAQLAPPPVLTPPAAPALPPAGTDPTPTTTPPPVATTPPTAPELSPPDSPQVATLPPDSRDTTPVPSVPESQPRPEAIRILYAAEATDLPQAAQDDLEALADWLQANPAVRVQIVGYASAATKSGSDARRRSLFRTLAVRTYLIENGVLSTRMDVRALGDRTEEEPKDRVEVRVPPS